MAHIIEVEVDVWNDDERGTYRVTAEVPDSEEAPYTFLAVTDARGREVEPGRGPLQRALWDAVDKAASRGTT